MHVTKEQMNGLDRLKKRSDFLRLGKSKDKWISKIMIIQKIENNPADKKINFGIIVSKKVSKLAVDRNKIKRQIKSAAYEIFSEHAKKEYDFVIIARNTIKNASFNDIKKDIKWCLKKMGCLESNIKDENK